MSTIDEVWRRLETALAANGNWSVRVERHSSGDGHSTPYVENYRAIAEGGHTFPEFMRSIRGTKEATPALALSALADALEARP